MELRFQAWKPTNWLINSLTALPGSGDITATTSAQSSATEVPMFNLSNLIRCRPYLRIPHQHTLPLYHRRQLQRGSPEIQLVF